VYANERPVKTSRDVIEEAEQMDALGTGITGGDPSTRFKRVLRYVRFLKSKFGAGHHIHIYCCRPFSREKLAELKKAGLDEIRFHLWSARPVELALGVGIRAGVELPVEPGSHTRFIKLFRELEEGGCDFVNLNELEFSETNLKGLKSRGLKLKPGSLVAVKGSEETALRVLRWGAENVGFDIHYCPSTLKDSVQLRNRLRRKAPQVARRHEVVTGDGLLFKGVILDLPARKLASIRKRLIRRYHLRPDLITVDRGKWRIELHWRLAKKLAEREPELRFAWVEEYPTHDRLETTVIPLGTRKTSTFSR
jgi:hypothetical protein